MFETIGLFGKYKDVSVREAVNGLAEYLRYRNIKVIVGETTADEIVAELADRVSQGLDADIDLGVVIGGDGTMLHVASTLAPREIPLVGVNMGRLGFLTDIPLTEMYEDIGRILDGEYKSEARLMLDIQVMRGEEQILSGSAVNDIVVGKGELEKLIQVQIYIDGEFVMDSRADGIIVATPTGSTAYAMSSGGPILHPQLDALVLVPVSPHTLTNRPIVLKGNSTVDFSLVDICEDCAHVSLDGQIKHRIRSEDRVRVRRSQHTVTLIRTLENNHYAALRSKLGWGGGNI